jgi:pimeloyl-ACP methyl ester carboxylesterase
MKTLKAIGLLTVMGRSLKTKKKNPIVFVPGLYGSMGDDIIPGTGDWNFGMAAPVYEPFIESLEKMGYELGKDLFIAFYDWRKECNYSMGKYLLPVIKQAKTKNRCKKVDIICHSMGGLLSRAYIQGKNYGFDVDKVIFIATPHAGAANSYSFWSEGKLLAKKSIESQMLTTLLEGYLWILTRINGYSNDMDTIHNTLRGAQDLLPSRDYGDYLYYFDKEMNVKYLPYEELQYKNNFLDELNEAKEIIKRRNIDTTLIVGKNIDTNEKFQISNDERRKILSVMKTSGGDGTVTFNSATAIEGDIYIFSANHTDILHRCGFAIKSKLGIEDIAAVEPAIVDSAIEEDNKVSIMINGKGPIRIKMEKYGGIDIIYDGTKAADNIMVQEYGDRLKWIVISNPDNKQIYLEYDPDESDTLDIQAKMSNGKKIKFKEGKISKDKTYRMVLQ